MVRELYIIVHEDAVGSYACLGSPQAKRAMGEIEKIKSGKDYLEIDSWNPNELHPDMPPKSDDLRVFVAGGFLHACCTMQMFRLKEEGYDASFLLNGTCPGQARAPLHMMEIIREKYPDFYNASQPEIESPES